MNFSSYSPLVQTYQPWFLLSSDHSGSNLLRLIMNSRKDTVGPGPYHILETFSPYLYRFGNLREDSNWVQFTRFFFSRLKTWASEKIDLNPSEVENWPTESRSFGKLYSSFYDCAAQAKSAQYVFIKEHDLHEHVGFLFATYPNAKFVYNVRDPRDVVTSFSKKHLYNPLSVVSQWKREQIKCLELLGWLHPEHLFFLRYEDLISDPKTVLTSLCSFLNIEFEFAMLEHHKSPTAINDGKIRMEMNKRKFGVNEISSDSLFQENLDRPIRSDTLGRYKEHLTPIEISYIESELSSIMKAFNYSLDTNPPKQRKSVKKLLFTSYSWITRLLNNRSRERVLGSLKAKSNKTLSSNDLIPRTTVIVPTYKTKANTNQF